MITDYERRRHGLTQGIRSLWINWAFPLAAVVIIILTAPFISKPAVPLITFAEVFLIFILIRHNRGKDAPYCFKIPYTIALTLFWSAIVTVVFNFFKFENIIDLNGQPYNSTMPLIPILIISPIGFIVFTRMYVRGKKCSFCSDCEARFGNTVERGFLSRMFTQESDFQIKVLMISWGVFTVIEWTYYFVSFINTNISNRDWLFFVWLPVGSFVISLIYMGIRYYIIWAFYCINDVTGQTEHRGFSRLRFLVICNDKMWLYIPDPMKENVIPGDFLIDTPVKTEVQFKASINRLEAAEYFKSLTGIVSADVRPLYISSDNHAASNIFHFAAYLNDFTDVDKSSLSGEWFSLGEIQELHTQGVISNLLNAELHRIHSTVMAWKTYSPDGKRLYAIKHYQPTFRLADMHKWDVDYNDPKWLFIAMNNEDRPFFRLRKFWRKYITGLGS